MMNNTISDKRLVDGMILVNKPRDVTSNHVLQQVKRLFCAKKAGHTGSLDPLATGMLPICFGEATKFSQYLLDADKCYEVTGLLGIKTNTADAMGDVIASVDKVSVSETQLLSVLADFVGLIHQVPSMFSALKHQGTPLYKFARKGIDIERSARPVHIHQLQLHAFDGRLFKMRVLCSKGTYIRNLVEDIGERLNVGAHVTQLHRVYTAGLNHESMFSIDALALMSMDQRLACLLPVDRAVNDLPKLVLDEYSAHNLKLGRPLNRCTDNHQTGLVRLYANDSQFMGLGEWCPTGELRAKRLLSIL
jgi:tRNA pseudouridine55 synthase